MADSPIVTIKQGDLRGKVDKDLDGFDFYTFHNIPYAKPPIGELRFRAPQPPEPWTGIRDATEEGNECASRHPMYRSKFVGSEDCLNLNVYTPELPKSNKNLKPVMLWIHGGGFKFGSSKVEMHGPEFLITGDIVLVTVNYRLGVFGFLSFEDASLGVPGNAGLKDIVMALRWVQENILNFNGDPGNVTIFGESSGGALVHYLVLSPMAKGLFHKAIAQSGVALNLWATGTRCRQQYMKNLGHENCTDEREMLRILEKTDKMDLVSAHWKIPDLMEAHGDALRVFGPVVENFDPNQPAFLLDEPINIIRSGDYNKVPMIIGYTSSEGMFFTLFKRNIMTDFEISVPHGLKLPRGSQMSKAIAHRIREFYFGDDDPADQKENYHDLQTDNFFLTGIYQTVREQRAVSDAPIYVYRFSANSKLNIYKHLGQINEKGACHGDELGHLFKMMITPEVRPGTLEDITLRRMVFFWTNFARTGNPNPAKRSKLFPVEWPRVGKEDIAFMDIGDNLTVGVNPDGERMEFWDGILALRPKTPSKM